MRTAARLLIVNALPLLSLPTNSPLFTHTTPPIQAQQRMHNINRHLYQPASASSLPSLFTKTHHHPHRNPNTHLPPPCMFFQKRLRPPRRHAIVLNQRDGRDVPEQHQREQQRGDQEERRDVCVCGDDALERWGGGGHGVGDVWVGIWCWIKGSGGGGGGCDGLACWVEASGNSCMGFFLRLAGVKKARFGTAEYVVSGVRRASALLRGDNSCVKCVLGSQLIL